LPQENGGTTGNPRHYNKKAFLDEN